MREDLRPAPKREDRFYASDTQEEKDLEIVDNADLLRDQESDVDRILLSPELHRLGGITQVISPLGHVPTHNRLTHSLEVANIGRRIAQRILEFDDPGYAKLIENGGGLEVGTVDAACLAHDLGHPPYGHVVEYALSREMARILGNEVDGFEGNAQSFRIVTALATRIQGYRGLGLTRATLAAIEKYPWSRPQMDPSRKDHPKWGYYQEDQAHFCWSRAHLPPQIQMYDRAHPTRDYRTLEAQIMDWADDVAYSTHDILDFVRLGAIPIEAFVYDSKEFQLAFDYHAQNRKLDREKANDARDYLKNHLRLIPKQRINEFEKDSLVALRQYGAVVIDNSINATSLKAGPEDTTQLYVEAIEKTRVQYFVDLVRMFVIDNRAMASQRIGQNTIVTKVFSELYSLAQFGQNEIDNDRIRDLSRIVATKDVIDITEGGKTATRAVARNVVDWIAGMTEQQLLATFKRMEGHELGMPLDPISY